MKMTGLQKLILDTTEIFLREEQCSINEIIVVCAKKILKKYILNIHIILKGKVMNAKFSSGATGKKVLKITCLINFER